MYVPPYNYSISGNTPKKYTSNARLEIQKKLALNSSFLRHGNSPLSSSYTANDLLSNSSQSTSDSSVIDYSKSIASPNIIPNNNNNNNSNSRINLKRVHSNQSSLSSQSNDSLSSFSSSLSSHTLINSAPIITLDDAIPIDFHNMYLPQFLSNLLPNGRPTFTKRNLIDWDLNDLRSLLILHTLKPEWNNKIPIIYAPLGFKIQLLPLDSSESQFVSILVQSDIYKEAKFSENLRTQAAQFTVLAAKKKHNDLIYLKLKSQGYNKEQIFASKEYHSLEIHEWRNIIENFLLNLAVEAQCCHDFKKIFLINSAKNFEEPHFKNSFDLSNQEKSFLWNQVQAKVYQKAGLDWTPDRV
ncbi:Std1p ASCRUDRAFT_40241 [Ascoidea rubescens DSM 1968]|uniref:Uncharacterized protein n=1 Tax=Ascoidea rubescens DSM 1968 TaxID=1344418 RepID=A0A1D2V872_9ASCO|nr:hypothetical protein ASCRUDRAFT_40241 [Ascoidea rubescens DSM 1968]ODV57871.1 hypothetical protein ASCRUDRAFT_40241 [Ascoidea rubescens DSM 1968]